jgi:ADP-ribose pyrophosphatase YjhB (NUDIX family)
MLPAVGKGMPDRFRLISAVHVFLLREGKIFLLRRANTGWGDGLFSVPAGHLDGNEQVIAAAVREVAEEAGVNLAPEDVCVVGVMHRKSNTERIDFFLAAEHWQGEPHNAEPGRCSETGWFSLIDLPSDTVPYVRRGTENFRAGRWFDSYGWQGEP